MLVLFLCQSYCLAVLSSCACTFHIYYYVQLNELFKKYAVKYPALGLTVEELKKFLMEECFVSTVL